MKCCSSLAYLVCDGRGLLKERTSPTRDLYFGDPAILHSNVNNFVSLKLLLFKYDIGWSSRWWLLTSEEGFQESFPPETEVSGVRIVCGNPYLPSGSGYVGTDIT